MKHVSWSRFALLTVALALLASSAVFAQGKMDKEMPKEKSLYQRLGGYDAIAAVVDDFIGRLVSDKALSRFFGGASTNSQKHFRQMLVDQVCAVTGGPCVYIGRDMKTAHGGLGITEAEWQAGVKDIVAALDKFKVPQKEKDDLIAVIATTKSDIVEKP
jgi:hemoglobin